MTKPVKPKYQVNGDERHKALFSAIDKGDVYALRLAYDVNYHSGKATKETGKKASVSKLLFATLSQQPGIVNFLVNARDDAKYDLHDWNEDGQNPLIEAIKTSQVDIVKIFAGAIANKRMMLGKSFKDAQGNTPFHHIGNIADVNVRKQMATALIQAGMSIDLVNDAGEKPKHHDELIAIKAENAHRFLSRFSNIFFLKPLALSNRNALLLTLPIAILTTAAFVIQPVTAFVTSLFALSYFMISHLASDLDADRRHLLDVVQIEADFVHTIKSGKLTKENLSKYRQEGMVWWKLTTTKNYEPIIFEAARAGHVAQLALLLEQGMQFDRRAVYEAIERGNTDAARFLISKAKVMLVSEFESAKLLVTAVYANKPEILTYLLEKGAKLPADIRQQPFVRGYLAGKPGKLDKAYSLLDLANDLGHKEIIALIENKDRSRKAAKAPAKVVTPSFSAKKQQAGKAAAAKKTAVDEPNVNSRRRSLRSATK